MGQSGSHDAQHLQYGTVVSSTSPAGGGRVYRHRNFGQDLADQPSPGVATLYDTFQSGLRVSPNGPCLGQRSVGPDGVPGPYKWVTYAEVWERVKRLGSGIQALDLAPRTEVEKMGSFRVLGVYSKNRPEWVITEQACNAHGIVLVPLYDTLGPDTVQFVINEAMMSTVMVGTVKEAQTVISVSEQCPTLKAVVIMDSVSELPQGGRLQVLTLESVEANGAQKPVDPRPPQPEDIATLCYTSGTTGNPKGAILTHRNLASVVAGATMAGVALNASDVHLSYLPLAHMFERVVEACIWTFGGSVGFFQGDTRQIMDDLKTLRPTIFPSVPRLYNKIYDTIIQKVDAKGGVGQKLFHHGLHKKEKTLRKKGVVTNKLYDGLVFGKVRAGLGLDRVRLMLTGSAPIAPHVMEFLRAAFACPVCEGYGATETGGASSVTDINDQATLGHVGGPLPCCEICLVDVPDMGYTTRDAQHGDMPVRERGEVCVKGPNIFKGYFRNKEKTDEVLDADGWYHTGDIGVWTTDGALKIVDRKKNIFKLAQGEYVAAEKLENIYGKSHFFEQIFIYGNSFHTFLIAIVVPDDAALKQFYQGRDVPTREVACQDPELKKAVLDDIVRLGKEAKVNSYEIPKDLILSVELFSVENNTLTPTFKLRRKEAQEMFQSQIDEAYRKEAIGGQAGGIKQ
eukprot:NODE_294_length_2501_cov_132.613377_g271_i0.p1 GENE.NODE_294_length_2501_cov_132.613377_g271_i0~~NODE_294_length_2501_cov_132.613377_g271_i0.p1  ORF type:complete len:681 (-),score=130.41 NODE_294_length_2501_cov_132.613377_g271_i0:368-2410(-)